MAEFFFKKTSDAAINITLGVPGQRADKRKGDVYSLCVCYLENHVFLGTRIDPKISARNVLNRSVEPTRLFRVPRTKEFLHRSSWSRVIGTKTFNPHYDAPKYGDR